PPVRTRARTWRAVQEVGLRPALADDPGVIRLIVLVVEAFDQLPRVAEGGRHIVVELVGERQHQGHDDVLIAGGDRERVETDALGFGRFVEQPIAFRFGEGPWHGVRRERFQFEPHDDLRNTRSSFLSGSYNSSTTRSWSGMMALSVMVMLSGHTFVQHFVMLQYPMPSAFFRSASRFSVSSGCISSAATNTKCLGPM